MAVCPVPPMGSPIDEGVAPMFLTAVCGRSGFSVTPSSELEGESEPVGCSGEGAGGRAGSRGASPRVQPQVSGPPLAAAVSLASCRRVGATTTGSCVYGPSGTRATRSTTGPVKTDARLSLSCRTALPVTAPMWSSPPARHNDIVEPTDVSSPHLASAEATTNNRRP